MAIRANYPDILPTLNLDFANTKKLDPRITFTRTTTATYYDGKTTAKAEENLQAYSQQFDDASWIKSRMTCTANAVTAPDGTSTADQLIEDTTASNTHDLRSPLYTFTNGLPYTFSIYAKPNATNPRNVIVIRLQGSSDNGVRFNISTGTIEATGLTATSSIVNAGNGWYRCIVTSSSLTGSERVYVALTDGTHTLTTIQSYTGDGVSGIFAWGAQLEQRSSVTAYTPTTTAAITNYIPVLQTASAGQARFDHNPTTGESLGLLIEEQRTNLALRSAEFDNASWTKTNSIIIANTIIAPDGTLTGDKLIADTTNGSHYFQNSAAISISNATSYTTSFYAKAGEYNGLLAYDINVSTYSFINLSNGTLSGNASSSIQSVGNGWYRITLTATSTSTSGIVRIILCNPSGTQSFTGDGYSGVYLWGAQLEAGPSATSYIPTTSATVTRNEDTVVMTGTNFNTWFNSAEFSVFCNYQSLVGTGTGTNGNVFVSLYDVNTNNSIALYGITTNSEGVYANSYSAPGVISSGLGTRTLNQRKAAYAIKENDYYGIIDNTTSDTDTSFKIPIITSMSIGRWAANPVLHAKYIRKIAFYPKRLLNTELQALTSV